MKLNIQLFAYTKKEWEDLPSKDTPILAADLNNIENQLQTNTNDINSLNTNLNNIENQLQTNTNDINSLNTNLNKIEDGIETNNKKLSGEEVIGNIVVDSIRTKNMFGNYAIINGWISGTTMRVASSNGNRMAFISCKPNTTYTISRSVKTSTFRVSDYTTIPTMTSSNVDYTIPTAIENNDGTTITYTTSSTAKYLIIHYGKEEESTSSDSLATIQVEEGSTATTYSAYQNLNGYDNYSTSEQRIGTWIDGKPIYRKIITKTSFTTGETTNTHGISNIDFIVNVEGVGIRKNGEQEFLPAVVPPSGMQNYQISVYDVTRTQYRMYMGSNTQTGNQTLETLYLIFEYTKTTD